MILWIFERFLIFCYIFIFRDADFLGKILEFLKDYVIFLDHSLIYTKKNLNEFLARIFFQIVDSPFGSRNTSLLLSYTCIWS